MPATDNLNVVNVCQVLGFAGEVTAHVIYDEQTGRCEIKHFTGLRGGALDRTTPAAAQWWLQRVAAMGFRFRIKHVELWRAYDSGIR